MRAYFDGQVGFYHLESYPGNLDDQKCDQNSQEAPQSAPFDPETTFWALKSFLD